MPCSGGVGGRALTTGDQGIPYFAYIFPLMFYFILLFNDLKYVMFRYFDKLKMILKIIPSREKCLFLKQRFMVKGNKFSISTYKPVFVMEI